MNVMFERLPLIALGLSAFVLYVVKRAYPRPFPGIPYNAISARRFWGDAAGVFETVKITQDPARYIPAEQDSQITRYPDVSRALFQSRNH